MDCVMERVNLEMYTFEDSEGDERYRFGPDKFAREDQRAAEAAVT